MTTSGQDGYLHKGTLPDGRERAAIAERQGGRATFEVGEAANTMTLWNSIDGTQTVVDGNWAVAHYLRKVVYCCSVCGSMDMFPEPIKNHARRVVESYKEHLGAELVQVDASRGQLIYNCTGCDAPLTNRKRQGQKHLEGIAEAYAQHMSAGTVDVVLRHKFTQSPSAPTPSQVVDSITLNGDGPKVQPVERGGEGNGHKRKRRRRRRH